MLPSGGSTFLPLLAVPWTSIVDLTLTSGPSQDLKDFGREGGNVSFADIDRDNPGDGSVMIYRVIIN
jgi:hypothetical protein